MKVFTITALTLALFAASAVAAADSNQTPYHPDITESVDTGKWRLGVDADLGLPSGGSLGVTLHPKVDWARVGVAVTYDYLSAGGRLSLQLDPMALIPISHERADGTHYITHNFPLGIFADVQGGFQPLAGIPGHSNLPQFGFDYVNLYGGLRLGTPGGFHWNIEVGPTYMHIATGNFQSILSSTGASGLKIGNPTVNGWLVPTFVTGFEVPITIGK